MAARTHSAHAQSAEQHADGNHAAHQQTPDKQELTEQAHQEGFIGSADPSPAVLKTEFPPELEPHLEQPANSQPDAPDGNIQSNNVCNGSFLCRQPYTCCGAKPLAP